MNACWFACMCACCACRVHCAASAARANPSLKILPSYAHGMANHEMHRNRLRALLLTLHGLAMCPFLLHRSIRPPFRSHHAQRNKHTSSQKAKQARGTRSVSAMLACFGTAPQRPVRIAQKTLSPIRKCCRQCGHQIVRSMSTLCSGAVRQPTPML